MERHPSGACGSRFCEVHSADWERVHKSTVFHTEVAGGAVRRERAGWRHRVGVHASQLNAFPDMAATWAIRSSAFAKSAACANCTATRYSGAVAGISTATNQPVLVDDANVGAAKRAKRGGVDRRVFDVHAARTLHLGGRRGHAANGAGQPPRGNRRQGVLVDSGALGAESSTDCVETWGAPPLPTTAATENDVPSTAMGMNISRRMRGAFM